MADLPLNCGTRWFCPAPERDELVIVSDFAFWISHWDRDFGRSRRCGGENCVLCCSGSPKVLRFVFEVVDESSRHFWFELRERHRNVISAMNDSRLGCAGSVIVVRRDGKGKTAPVDVRFVSRRDVVATDISRFVASLGLPALCLGDEGEEADRYPNQLPHSQGQGL